MAGGKSNTIDADVLALLLNGTTIANIAINATSSPLTSLWVALHTSSPGASGSQTTNEAAYGSYARVAVARNPGSPAWTVTGESISPNSTITFPTASSGSETETYASVGTASSGAGTILYWGPISPTIAVSAGTIPQLTTASTITES